MKIKESKNYEQFGLLDFNRDVDHTNALERSMKTHGWIDAYPAHVVKEDGKLKIKDGHHRFTVAQKLGIPVKYVVCSDDITIQEIESSHNKWNMDDYLTSYVRAGLTPYIAIKELQMKTGISLAAIVSMCAGESAGSKNKNKQFKTGTFRIKDTKHIEDVYGLICVIAITGASWANTTLVTQSLSKIALCSKVNTRRLKDNIKKYPFLIKKQPNLQSYLEMFEKIYNHNSKDKIPLAFIVKESAHNRQPAAIGRAKQAA